MKKFKFELETVLQLREFREEECRVALGQAVGALTKIEIEIMETAIKRHSAAMHRFADTDEMAAWENYIQRLDQQAQYLTEQAAQAQLVVEEKRGLYLEASRELKAIEKLKEQQKKEHRREMFNLEMKEVDDMTAARFLTAGS